MKRKAKISRKTKETSINVDLNIDGKGKYKIKSGIGFLDHMLEQLTKHSSMDLNLIAKGDTHIDLHHTTEDTGIAIGEAIKKAAGNRKGIKRYASTMIPMDETLSRISIDVSNRPYLIWKVNLAVEKLGEMDTELLKEWCQAFSHPGVGVQTAHPQVHHEVGEQHADEPQHQDHGRPSAGPAPQSARVQVGGVDQPGHQGRRLLGVPVPVASPGGVAPVRPQRYSQRQQRKPNHHRFVANFVQQACIGQARESVPLAVLCQIQDTGAEGDAKGAIGQDDRCHVQRQEVLVLEGGHERLGVGREEGGGGGESG